MSGKPSDTTLNEGNNNAQKDAENLSAPSQQVMNKLFSSVPHYESQPRDKRGRWMSFSGHCHFFLFVFFSFGKRKYK